MKSKPSKTQHAKKSRHPKTPRASGCFLILALTSPVPSVSSLPQLPKPGLLRGVSGCLLPVPQRLCLGGKLVFHALVLSSPVAAYSTSRCSCAAFALSWIFSQGQDSGSDRVCSWSLSFLTPVPVLPAGALPVRGRGHWGTDGAAP